MKSTMLVLTLLSLSLFAQTQPHVRIIAANKTTPLSGHKDIQVPSDFNTKNTFILRCEDLKPSEKLTLKFAGLDTTVEFLKSDPTEKAFEINKDITEKKITISHQVGNGAPNEILTFRFIKSNNPDLKPENEVTSSLGPISDYLDAIVENYEYTQLGWVRKTTGMDVNERRKHANITHIFFDEYGNSLLGAIPQGIANRQYFVHLIYRGYKDEQGEVRYSVKQKSGSFSSALNINNSGALKNLPGALQGDEEGKPYDTWKEDVYPLGISTDDIVFDIVATAPDEKNKPVRSTLETHTIKMSPVYHATIDVGLLNSELVNPTFSLVDAPDGSANKVVKETDRSSQGVVTIMATFYTSPVVLVEKLFQKRIKKNIPNYKLTGRSIFDDHSLFERIYPSLGVSVSGKSFENLFFGLNWEIARGLSVFGGGHWGKVNTFEMPNFIPGETPVTEDQFEFYKNSKWKVAWSYGAKVDVQIVTNLFK